MTFAELYKQEKNKANGARPMEFLERVAVAAIVSVEAVYSWATGWRNPNKAAAEMVARELGIPSAELFPNLKKARQ